MKRAGWKRTDFIVISFDPSLTGFGIVVMKGKKIIHTECVKTSPAKKKLRIRKADDRTRRIAEINDIIKELINIYNVRYIVSELPHGSQSAVAAFALGMVTAQIQTISDFTGIPIEWYSEADCKKALLRKQSAAKSDIIFEIDQLYEVDWPKAKYKQEAIADALAVHHCALKHSTTLKLLT